MSSTCDISGRTFAKPFNLRRHERGVHCHILHDHNDLMSSGELPNRLSRLKPTGPGFWEARDFVDNEFLYLFSFVETPRKFIIAELSIRKLGSSSVLIILYY